MQVTQNTNLSLRELPGTVYSLGPDSANAAALYAGLTGRRCVKCGRLSEMTLRANDVVVTTCDNLTVQLMHQMFILASGGCPGLICAATEGELMNVCRQQADRLTADPQLQRRKRVFVYPLLSFASLEKSTDHFISGSEQTESLVESLTSNAAQLAIVSTHSDGIGFNLSLRHFACPFVSITESGNDRIPPCQMLGRCLRFTVPPTIQEARDAGWLIPLSALRASVLLISGCNIVRLQDGIVDARYGLASTLFSQAAFGAAIVTWRRELGTADGVHLNSLMNDIALGTPVGTAVFAFNQSPLARHFGLNLSILGDPCFALNPLLSFPVLPTSHPDLRSFKREPLAIEATSLSEARLLKDITVAAIGTNGLFDAAKGNRLAAALSAYATSEASGTPQPLDELDSLLLDFGGATPWLDKILWPFGRLESSNEGATCPICMAPARSIVMSFPTYQASHRHVIRCACCDDSSILPIGWKVDIDLSQLNEHKISATVPKQAKVLFCLGTYAGTTFTSRGEPGLREGHYVFQLPDDLAFVPLHCQILIARRLQIGAMSFRIRQLSGGQLSTARSISNEILAGVSST
jgi:hypothetical protein